MRFFLAFILGMIMPLLGASALRAQAVETRAASALMVDAGTGTVLLSKDPDEPVPPASLGKLMTVEVVFHALKAGRIGMDDLIYVSENAWRTGGAPSRTSTMFAEVKSEVPLSDILRGIIVQQANDGAIAVAEAMAGSEQAFAELMNERAREIGLTGSHFVNATGFPAEGQKTTMRDMAMLAQHLAREYPDLYPIFSETEFTWNRIRQLNRHPLLRMDIGAEGLATGYSEEGGFAIVGAIKRDGRHIFIAASGLSSDAQRADETRRLLDWSMRSFELRQIFARDEVVGEAKLYGGAKRNVPLTAQGPVAIYIPVNNPERLVARIVYEGPVLAPVEEGRRVGALRVWIGDTMSQETPLYAAESVALGPVHRRALDAIEELMIGWMR